MRRRLRLRDDDGSVTIEAVIVYPALLAVVFVTIQAGLFYNGREMAISAAQVGVREAVIAGGDAGIAQDAAATWLAEQSAGALDDPAVSVPQADGQIVRVQVTGSVPSLVPGFGPWQITQQAAGPVEDWTPQ